MSLPKLNLHIHTTYSDGKNTVNQIVKTAIKLGLDYICITDHFSNSWKSKIIPTLNNLDKIERYLEEISHCQAYILKKNRKLNLFKGVEIDISSSENYIINNIHPNKFDLILFEYLENLEGIAFIKNLIETWKRDRRKSNKFPLLGLAHFDPSFFMLGGFNVLLGFLKQYNIIIEFNSSYPRFYSRKYETFFNKLKKNGIMVSIGCDSHHLSNLKDVEGAYEAIKSYNLEDNLKNLIKSLEMRKN